MIRETVRDGEPALAVDTEEEFARALGSGVYEENTNSLKDVLAASDPSGWVTQTILLAPVVTVDGKGLTNDTLIRS